MPSNSNETTRKFPSREPGGSSGVDQTYIRRHIRQTRDWDLSARRAGGGRRLRRAYGFPPARASRGRRETRRASAAALPPPAGLRPSDASPSSRTGGKRPVRGQLAASPAAYLGGGGIETSRSRE